jgi:hypothetical protein
MIVRGYDPDKHLVRNAVDLHQRLSRLHEHAAVAWDRDGMTVLDEVITVSDPIADAGALRDHGVLGYAVDRGRRIFRLVRDEVNDLGIRWVEYDRHAPTNMAGRALVEDE